MNLKIGRNDPCPCGSGKKFKKCHFGREHELPFAGAGEALDTAERITALPEVSYGRCREFVDELRIQELTGKAMGIRFVDLGQYRGLGLSGGGRVTVKGGGVVINLLKTQPKDPDHIYVAVSEDIGDSALAHQVAHVLDYLSGSGQIPGLQTALSCELGIPVEHLEHPREFGQWLHYLVERFGFSPDADDAIILFLYGHDMLIRGEEIQRGDRLLLKARSDRIFRFLSEHGAEIEALICELPGYIGSRVGKD